LISCSKDIKRRVRGSWLNREISREISRVFRINSSLNKRRLKNFNKSLS
jgi:hypothetical protein